MVAMHHGLSLEVAQQWGEYDFNIIDLLSELNSFAYFGSCRNSTKNKEKLVS